MHKDTKVKMNLSDLIISEKLLRLRPVNVVFVSRYAQAYRAGAPMPLVVVDRKTKRVVSGNHRVTAMRQEYGDDHEVEVILKDFANEKEMLVFMTKENAPLGVPLSGVSRVMISRELLKVGCTPEEVATLFSVTVSRIEEWGKRVAYIVGCPKSRRVEATAEQVRQMNRGEESVAVPIKRGPDIEGKDITEEQYVEHMAVDKGLPAYKLAEQLTRWLRNGWIDRGDGHTIEALSDLYEGLEKFFTVDKRRARA